MPKFIVLGVISVKFRSEFAHWTDSSSCRYYDRFFNDEFGFIYHLLFNGDHVYKMEFHQISDKWNEKSAYLKSIVVFVVEMLKDGKMSAWSEIKQ